MNLDSVFSPLPYGFSSFSDVKDSLIQCRAINRLPENAQTVISVLFPYYLGEEFYKDANVSRYAVSADYHIITSAIMEEIKKDLREMFPENVFESFVDSSPLPEVRCAVNAGLGMLGINNLFINKDYGSWVFLGEIVTDRYFPPYEGRTELCSSCRKCMESCPVGAITGQGIIKEKCLSFLSQKKGELDEKTAELIEKSGCAWGCDICQRVCPHNIHAKTTPIKEFFETAKPHVTGDDPVEGRAFAWRGEAVIRRNLKILDRR